MPVSRVNAGVVLPLGPGGPSDPWELLARGEGALLTTSNSTTGGTAWRTPLRSGSVLERLLAQATSRGPQLVGPQGGRYRLELPTGFGEQDLMRALGRGVRGNVRGPGGKIAGQARLVKLGPKAFIGALTPAALGLLAFSVVSEMVGGDEQERVLTSIREGVDRLNARFEMEDNARLRTAEQTIRRAHAALLDGAAVPQSVGLGSAMTELQVIRNRSEHLLTEWEKVLDSPSASDEASGAMLRESLGSVGKLGWEAFPGAVRTAYHAIALDSRRVVLTAVEAQVGNPGASLSHFHASVADELAERAAELDRLRSVLDRLAGTPLTITTWGGGLLPHLVTDGAVENARTQALFARLSASLNRSPTMTAMPSLAADSAPDGSLTLVRST